MPESTQTKVSIIVPVFNVEGYIRPCILSLLNQTIDSMEIIVVDDRGNDSSMQIVHELIATHERASVIKILSLDSNSGAALARNAGLKIAKGEYIGFVDSDDWCESEMFDELYKQAKTNSVDWCYCNAYKDEGNARSILCNAIINTSFVSLDIREKMLVDFVAYFWTGIYKRSFLESNKIDFPAYRFSEDSYFVFNVLAQAATIASIDKPMYHYIVREGSVTNTYNATKEQQRLDVFAHLLDSWKLNSFYRQHSEAIDFLYFKKAFLMSIFAYILSDSSTARGLKPRVSFFNLGFPKFSSNKYIKKKMSFRIVFFLLNHFPFVARILIKCYGKKRKGMF